MRVFLIAGEPSGDRLGGALMQGLSQIVPDVAYDGVGGPAMADQGLVSRFPMDELSVMGIAEVLPRYRSLLNRIDETAAAVIETEPDVLITIDSPDFCLRVAKRVRARSRIRTVHYVAPSVWAWRKSRAAKMAKSIDQVLALLPFEPPFMEAAGMRCDFVGHPIATEPVPTQSDIQRIRSDLRLGDAPAIAVLPGSRRSEVERLALTFGEALRPLLKARPDLRVVVPAAGPVAALVESTTRNWPGAPVVLDPRGFNDATASGRKKALFAASDLALAASGTVSLELAAAGTPMVVAYDMNWFSWQIVSRMVQVDTVTLVNLVAQSRTVPEFLGPACKPADIANALIELADPASERRTLQLEAMAETMRQLGRGGEAPGLRAAKAVMEGIRS